MTMTPPRPIPAELLEDQPISEDALAALATAAEVAAAQGLTLGQLLERASVPEDERPEQDQIGPVAAIPSAVARWIVDDDRKAEWAMRKLAAVKVEEAEVNDLADSWVADVERWRADRLRPLAARRAFFEPQLEAYALALREANPKAKTLTLPSGVVKTTASSAKVGVPKGDPEAEVQLIAWAKAHLEGDDLAAVVKTTETVLVGGLRDVAEVAERPIATRWDGALSCGHELTFQLPIDADLAEVQVPHVGDGWPCGDCPEEFGEPVASLVVELSSAEVMEQVVVDTDSGQVVPGAAVVAETVTAKVTPA